MSVFEKLETFAYRNIVVPLQGSTTFDFVNEHYNKGMKVLDFGCGTGSNSKLFHSDLFENYPINRLKKIDVIVCNPPYIPTCNYLSLNNETLYDPRISLDGGELGLDYYIKIIDYLINVKFKGSLYFEIDPIISENMYKYLLEKGIKIVYKKVDYLSLDRLIKITLPNINSVSYTHLTLPTSDLV